MGATGNRRTVVWTLPQVAPRVNSGLVPLPLGQPPAEVGWTVWPAPSAGQHVAWGGVHHQGTWAAFCAWLAAEHQGPAYPKGRSPHYSMVHTRPEQAHRGHRCNAAVAAVSAVSLDYDGDGDVVSWDTLLQALDAAGVAYCIYQSGGWSPARNKWHLVLPFSLPFVVGGSSGPHAAEKWRRVYHTLRVLVGRLTGCREPVRGGYDHQPCALSSAAYPGYRRSEDAPVRQMRWRDGLALDGAALAAQAEALPIPLSQGRSATGSPYLDMEMAGGKVPGTRTKETLPSDTVITLSPGGSSTVGGVKFGDIARNSHCHCPRHGGSGRGAAWVWLSPYGPRLTCAKCEVTWHPGATDAERQALAHLVESLVAEAEAETETTATTETIEQRRAGAAYHTLRSARGLRDYYGRLLRAWGMHPLPGATRCSGLVQVLRSRQGHLGSRYLGCGRPTCYWCAAQKMAAQTASIIWSPLLQGGKCGPAFAARRHVYLGRLTGSLDAYRQAWSRAQKPKQPKKPKKPKKLHPRIQAILAAERAEGITEQEADRLDEELFAALKNVSQDALSKKGPSASRDTFAETANSASCDTSEETVEGWTVEGWTAWEIQNDPQHPLTAGTWVLATRPWGLPHPQKSITEWTAEESDDHTWVVEAENLVPVCLRLAAGTLAVVRDSVVDLIDLLDEEEDTGGQQGDTGGQQGDTGGQGQEEGVLLRIRGKIHHSTSITLREKTLEQRASAKDWRLYSSDPRATPQALADALSFVGLRAREGRDQWAEADPEARGEQVISFVGSKETCSEEQAAQLLALAIYGLDGPPPTPTPIGEGIEALLAEALDELN